MTRSNRKAILTHAGATISFTLFWSSYRYFSFLEKQSKIYSKGNFCGSLSLTVNLTDVQNTASNSSCSTSRGDHEAPWGDEVILDAFLQIASLSEVRENVPLRCEGWSGSRLLNKFFTIFVKSLKMFCSVYPNYSVLKPNFSIFVRKSLHRIVGTHKHHLQFALIEGKSQTIFPVFYLRRPVKVSGRY